MTYVIKVVILGAAIRNGKQTVTSQHYFDDNLEGTYKVERLNGSVVSSLAWILYTPMPGRNCCSIGSKI